MKMKRTIVAIVAVAGIVLAFAPGSQASESPAAAGTSQVKPAQPAQGAAIPAAGIMKADQTIAEIYAGQNDLLGIVVNVRGKVVKFSPQIMGKNWVHLQDGTGTAGTNDLTVTTADSASVGDTVLVTGKITLKKDFGMGYKYDLIIEDGKVAVEVK
jgi:hypothetical protein